MDKGLIYLTANDVAQVLPAPSELLEILRIMFQHKSDGKAEMTPKLGVHPVADSFIHAMPASIPSMSATGVKWVSAYPGNVSKRLPQVSGLIILNDPESGLAEAVLDGSAITAARTAAASVLAARYLAQPEASALGILGCGVQGRSHLQAFAAEFEIQEVAVFDTVPESAQRLALEMSEQVDTAIRIANSARDVVEASDLIVTAGPITSPPHATIQAGWMQAGAFASSIDYGSYWHKGALAEVAILCTDDVPQYVSHQLDGYLKGLPTIQLELAHLVAGIHAGRTDATQRTLACNLGIALEDIVIAKEVVDRAKRLAIGQYLKR